MFFSLAGWVQFRERLNILKAMVFLMISESHDLCAAKMKTHFEKGCMYYVHMFISF